MKLVIEVEVTDIRDGNAERPTLAEARTLVNSAYEGTDGQALARYLGAVERDARMQLSRLVSVYVDDGPLSGRKGRWS